jgi:hypothetical protein
MTAAADATNRCTALYFTFHLPDMMMMMLRGLATAAAAIAATVHGVVLTAWQSSSCRHSTRMRRNSAAVDATHTARGHLLLRLLLLQRRLGQQGSSSPSGALSALRQTPCCAAPAVRQLAGLLVIQR